MKTAVAVALCLLFSTTPMFADDDSWYFKQHDVKLQMDWMRSSVPGLAKEQQKLLARVQTVF